VSPHQQHFSINVNSNQGATTHQLPATTRKVSYKGQKEQSSSSRTSSKYGGSNSQKALKRKHVVFKKRSSIGAKNQEKVLDRLTDNQAKLRWIKVAKINLEEAEK